jgi:hypothetical protein
MNGDVWQWNEALIGGDRGLRGGSFSSLDSSYLSSSGQDELDPALELFFLGFRVASVPTPEPGTGVLAIIGCGVILWWRKRFK